MTDNNSCVAVLAEDVFARHLQQWRVSRDLPLKAVAMDLGVSVSTISAWENGTRYPSLHHLASLSRYMNMPACALLYADQTICPLCNRCPARTTPSAEASQPAD